MSIEKITAGQLSGLVARPNVTVMAKFFATWCGPCRQFAPVMEKFAAAHPEIICCELDIDDPENVTFCADHNIATVPTVILYRNGEISARTSGFLNLNSLNKLLEA